MSVRHVIAHRFSGNLQRNQGKQGRLPSLDLKVTKGGLKNEFRKKFCWQVYFGNSKWDRPLVEQLNVSFKET